jgi:catechol 2,3-dioxygenase-like lactoylglutathione lyase family enzyme
MKTLKYTSTLIAVADMEISKQFYHDVLGLEIVADFGDNVTLDGGIALQTMNTWKTFIRTDNVILPNNAGELYFEEEDMDTFCNHLKKFDICYVHPLFEHRWGQRVVRFYDPDKHIIEVGEKLDAVILRFMENGLSAEETAVRMDIPFDFVRACLNKG